MARRDPWIGLSFDTLSLGLEATSVIAMRTFMLATGGAGAQAEATRMVSEKIQAGLEFQTLALTGGLGGTAEGAAARTLAHYRRKVRANRRRLSRR